MIGDGIENILKYYDTLRRPQIERKNLIYMVESYENYKKNHLKMDWEDVKYKGLAERIKFPENIVISSGCNLETDLDWSDVVVLNGSGVEVEAAIKGCYTIFIGSDYNLDLNYLDFEEHNAVVRTISEIKNEFTYLINNRNKLIKLPWTKEKRKYYYEHLSPDAKDNLIIEFKNG